MLASTLIPQPYSMTHDPLEEDVNMSFGRYVYSKCLLDHVLLQYFHYSSMSGLLFFNYLILYTI